MIEQSQELLPCPFCGEMLVCNSMGGHWAHDAQSNGACILSSMGVTNPVAWNTRTKASPTLADASLKLQRAILKALAAVPEEGWCVGLRGLSGRTGLSREVCRAIVADLRAAGLASYHKGLWSDDERPAGAGYAITQAGLTLLASSMEKT
jgi:hypothetical protein